MTLAPRNSSPDPTSTGATTQVAPPPGTTSTGTTPPVPPLSEPTLSAANTPATPPPGPPPFGAPPSGQTTPGAAPRGRRGFPDRQRRRLDRQFEAIGRLSPAIRRALERLRGPAGMAVRVPLGLVLVSGGLLWFLPVFGLWMLPAGLLLLAVDVPLLRPAVSAALIRLRRHWTQWRRRGRPSPPP